MGAYENPVTVVDTESAKYWAQAIGNLGNTMVKSMELRRQRLAASNKAQAEQDKFTLDYSMKKRDHIYDVMAKANIINPSKQIAIDNLLKDNLKYWKMSQYGADETIKSYGLAQQGKVQKMLSSIVPLSETIDGNRREFISKYQPGNLGEQNNYVYNKDKQWENMQKVMMTDSGLNPGKAVWSYDSENLDAGFNINYTGERFKEEGGYNISATSLANYIPTAVPLANKELGSLLGPNDDNNPGGLDIVNAKGQLTDDNLNYDNVTVTPNPDGSADILTIQPAYGKIAGAINTRLETNAMAILKDTDRANAWWQNVMVKDSNGKPLPEGEGGEGIFTKEGTMAFVEAYKRYTGTLIPDSKYIDLNSDSGKAFLETTQGLAIIKKMNLKYNEETEKWTQVGVDRDSYKGDDSIEGLVYYDAQGERKVTKASQEKDVPKWKADKAATTTRLNTLNTNMKDLSLTGQQVSGSEGTTTINFNSAFKKKIDNLGFDVGEAKNDQIYGQVVKVRSQKTNQTIELHSKGMTLSQLKQRLYLLDGGNTSDQAYKDLAPTDPWDQYKQE